MDGSSKVLKIIFAVLLVIVVAELYYFIFYQPSNKSQSNNSSVGTSTSVLTVVPNRNSEDQAINEDTLNDLKQINKGVLTDASIVTECSGKIVGIDNNPGVTKSNFLYVFKVRILGKEDKTNTFYYNEKEVNLMKVFAKKDNEDVPASISDFKLGDQIVIKETKKLFENLNDNVSELEIYIIN